LARRLLVLAALLSLHAAPASAQSAHYWGAQFGNESVLLNGTVIGSVNDLGAVFYNPARLLHMDTPAFVVSAKLYERTSIRVEDGLGEGEDLSQTTFGGAPGFLGGTFTIPFLQGHQFAYGLLTRDRGNFNYFLRDESSGELIDFLPGEDDFIGFIEIGNEFKNDWAGLSWAYSLSEQWSVGATGFYYNRSAGKIVDLDLRAINETHDAAGLQAERAYRISDQGFVGKLGLAWQDEALSIGLTATTPYWSVLRSGTVRYETFQIGIPGDDGTTVDNILESSVQTDLPVEWKMPWAIGAGLGWTKGKWLFHGAAEYFSDVPRYTILRADPVLGQSTGQPLDFSIVDERQAVVNGGVGARWRRSESFSAFASVATNFSAAPDSIVRITRFEPTASHTGLQMDFVLLGGGLSFGTRWADLTLGATWQASSEPARRLLNLPDEGDVEPESDRATVRVDQWRFLFGFAFPFQRGGEDEVQGDGSIPLG
jgi:hypothetical protein